MQFSCNTQPKRNLNTDLPKCLSTHSFFQTLSQRALLADRFPLQIKPWDLRTDTLSPESCFPTDYISLVLKKPGNPSFTFQYLVLGPSTCCTLRGLNLRDISSHLTVQLLDLYV